MFGRRKDTSSFIEVLRNRTPQAESRGILTNAPTPPPAPTAGPTPPAPDAVNPALRARLEARRAASTHQCAVPPAKRSGIQ